QPIHTHLGVDQHAAAGLDNAACRSFLQGFTDGGLTAPKTLVIALVQVVVLGVGDREDVGVALGVQADIAAGNDIGADEVDILSRLQLGAAAHVQCRLGVGDHG